MTPLEQIAQALEHARPHVKGAALEREVGEALDIARAMVAVQRYDGEHKGRAYDPEKFTPCGLRLPVPWHRPDCPQCAERAQRRAEQEAGR